MLKNMDLLHVRREITLFIFYTNVPVNWDSISNTNAWKNENLYRGFIGEAISLKCDL